jgi:hypothetical protein
VMSRPPASMHAQKNGWMIERTNCKCTRREEAIDPHHVRKCIG